MSGRLAGYVHVTDEDGAPHVFGPDSDVPAWAEKAITNKKAWAEAPEPDDESDDGEGRESGEVNTEGGSGVVKPPSNADLEAEIAKRNEGRDEAGLIKPASAKKADLVAALEADNQKS